MAERERLLELIGRVQDEGRDYSDVVCSYPTSNGGLADYLIANGVKIPVLCKDCKHWVKSGQGCGYCKAWEQGRVQDHYCSCGEKRNS